MNATSPHNTDELDRLCADFFKSQLKHPWPKAPGAASERSERVVAPARRDNTARARFTLAASVALLLGTCWMLSNGFQPVERTNGTVPTNTTANPMSQFTADGDKHEPLEKIEENKAKANGGAIPEVKFE